MFGALLGGATQGLGGLIGPSGPAVSTSGPAVSGQNTVIVPDTGLNVGAIVNALGGDTNTGGLPIQLANGIANPGGSIGQFSTSIGVGDSAAGFSLAVGPMLLIGAGIGAFFLMRK